MPPFFQALCRKLRWSYKGLIKCYASMTYSYHPSGLLCLATHNLFHAPISPLFWNVGAHIIAHQLACRLWESTGHVLNQSEIPMVLLSLLTYPIAWLGVKTTRRQNEFITLEVQGLNSFQCYRELWSTTFNFINAVWSQMTFSRLGRRTQKDKTIITSSKRRRYFKCWTSPNNRVDITTIVYFCHAANCAKVSFHAVDVFEHMNR